MTPQAQEAFRRVFDERIAKMSIEDLFKLAKAFKYSKPDPIEFVKE